MRKAISLLPSVLAVVLLYLPASPSFGQPHPDEDAQARALIQKLGGSVSPDPETGMLIVHLEDTAVTDEDLRLVAALPGLRRLSLDRTGITDGGIQHLERSADLKEVSLYQTNVTEAGAEKLRRARPGLIVLHAPRESPVQPRRLLALLFVLPFLAAGVFLLCAGLLWTSKPLYLRIRVAIFGAVLALVCTLLTAIAILQALGLDINVSRMFG
jgi:hypothetical protein